MQTQTVLNQVSEGMDVYDASGDHMGKVVYIRFGEPVAEADMPDNVTIAEELTEALGGSVEIPTVVYGRLYREGFVRFDRGLLRHDGFVFPTQIAYVNDDGIHLNVDKDEVFVP